MHYGTISVALLSYMLASREHIGRIASFSDRLLDSDNGSEFINHHLYTYCQRKGISFTRSRPYKKNDSAHVEQKNWSVVRRLVGYDRYSSMAALDQMDSLYQLVRLYVNFFQPVMKLRHKTRNGAKVHKVYDTARTPYLRLLDRDVVTPLQKEALAKQYQRLNPVRLLHQINQALEHLWSLAEPPGHNDDSVTLSSEATMALG